MCKGRFSSLDGRDAESAPAGQLGEFGREVYVKMDLEYRIIGYCCRACYAELARTWSASVADRLTSLSAAAAGLGDYSGAFVEGRVSG